MKKYNVTVNGTAYEVTLEVVDAADVKTTAAPAPAGAGTITAPMSGNIFKLLVNVGDTVKNGQAVVILEAMKMENEIFAPCDGTVKEVRVAQGATVQPGEVLLVIG